MKKLTKMKGKKRNYKTPEVHTMRLEAIHLMAASEQDGKDFLDGGYYGRSGSPLNGWE